MKTTNNKLLDNTGNPVSHNRPTEKYSYRTFDGEHKTELIPISDAKYIKLLEKENQELKDQLHMLKALDVENRKLIQENFNKFMEKQFDYENQFLKVVESVLGIHIHMNDKCSCCWESETDTFNEHLLQEIKSAIEITNLEQVQDKKGKDEKEK